MNKGAAAIRRKVVKGLARINRALLNAKKRAEQRASLPVPSRYHAFCELSITRLSLHLKRNQSGFDQGGLLTLRNEG